MPDQAHHPHGRHPHVHRHLGGARLVPDLPLSIMAQSAVFRVGAVAVVLIVLWLAVLWAVSLP